MSPTESVTQAMWVEMSERVATIEQALREHDEREKSMEERQKEIHRSVTTIEKFIAQLHGGVKVLFWVGGLASAGGSAIAWFWANIWARA